MPALILAGIALLVIALVQGGRGAKKRRVVLFIADSLAPSFAQADPAGLQGMSGVVLEVRLDCAGASMVVDVCGMRLLARLDPAKALESPVSPGENVRVIIPPDLVHVFPGSEEPREDT